MSDALSKDIPEWTCVENGAMVFKPEENEDRSINCFKFLRFFSVRVGIPVAVVCVLFAINKIGGTRDDLILEAEIEVVTLPDGEVRHVLRESGYVFVFDPDNHDDVVQYPEDSFLITNL